MEILENFNTQDYELTVDDNDEEGFFHLTENERNRLIQLLETVDTSAFIDADTLNNLIDARVQQLLEQ